MRRWLRRRIGLPATLALLALAVPGAWAAEERRVLSIEVDGLRTVAPETVLANVQTRAGLPYREAIASEDIRRLFGLGYFTDVRVDLEEQPDGLRVVFVVKEKPVITSIEVQGQRRLSKPKVLELLGVETGELYDARKLKQGADVIRAELTRKGHPQADVVAQATVDEATNTARAVVLVDEGPRMQIRRVLVEGNETFSDRKLRHLLKTKRRWWFFHPPYDEKVLGEDDERVRAFYRKHGYQDVTASHQVGRDPSGKALYAHFTVREGVPYRLGGASLAGATLFPERELLPLLRLKPGAVYNTELVQEDVRAVQQYYGDRGYIHAEVTPDPHLDAASQRVQLTYRVTEGQLIYVNRIDIQGNLRTKDEVIRRELRVYPGERFDGGKIRKSLDRLYNLGYFEEVNVDTQPTTQPTRADLVVSVKEAKTGSFSFGGGFSSVDRLVGLVEFEQRNFDWKNFPSFTGAAQDLRLRMEIGSVRRYFDASFTEPWIFGHPVSFGVDLYNRTRLEARNLGLGYEEEKRGGGVRLGREFADVVQTSLSYQIFETEISDVVQEASADLKAQQGQSVTSLAGLSLALDRRNNRLDQTSGSYLFTTGDLAGGVLFGDNEFYRLQGGGSYYWPHGAGPVLEARVRAGIVDAYGGNEEVPIFERFFSGGSGTIRGFRERRVGPRDPSSNDPIGGESTLLATLEEVVTLVRDERDRAILKGTVFIDVGNVWRRVGEFGESFKAGAGVGARLNTPIGPIRLDLGFPITEPDEDESRKPRFHFNVSRSF